MSDAYVVFGRVLKLTTLAIEPEITIQHPALKNMGLKIGEVATLTIDETSTDYMITDVKPGTITMRKVQLSGKAVDITLDGEQLT